MHFFSLHYWYSILIPFQSDLCFSYLLLFPLSCLVEGSYRIISEILIAICRPKYISILIACGITLGCHLLFLLQLSVFKDLMHFKGWVGKKEGKHRCSIHPLVYFQNVTMCRVVSSCSQEPKASSHLPQGSRGPGICVFLHCFSLAHEQEAGLIMEHQGLEQEPLWDAGVP